MRVLIVDDDYLVVSALKTILSSDKEIEVAGCGHNGREAITLYHDLKPEVLLMDIRMGEMTGIEACETIMKVDREAKVLFLTTFLDDEYIMKALKIGAKGYILKQNFESIVPAVKTVYAGQRVYGDEIIDKLPSFSEEQKKQNPEDYQLSEKEFEIITLIAEGMSNKELSESPYLDEGKVRNYHSI